MPSLSYRFDIVRQRLDESLVLDIPICLPAIARLSRRDDAVSSALFDQLAKLIAEAEPDAWHQFVLPSEIHVDQFELKISPPSGDNHLWAEEVKLPVSYLWWQCGEQTQVAFVPSLGIHAIAVGGAMIEHETRREARAALVRRNATQQLRQLARVARFGELELAFLEQPIEYPTTKQRASQESDDAEENTALKKVALRLTPENVRPGLLIENQTSKLVEMLTGPQPQSVLMVGPSGCGKTATFHAMIHSANTRQLDHFEFWQTDGSRLIAGMSGFGQWQERCSEIVNELSKSRAILHLGNLIELMEVGRGGGISQGIADFFRPFLVRGKMLAVAECTPEQVALIERQSPQMLDAFFRLNIDPPDREQTASILLDVARTRSTQADQIVIEPDAITAVESLHRRYANYSAKPGRVIRFLENLIDDQVTAPSVAASSEAVNLRNEDILSPTTNLRNGDILSPTATPKSATSGGRMSPLRSPIHAQSPAIIDAETVTAAFSKQTGLPQFLLSDAHPLDLDQTHEWFSGQVIGQPEPVNLTVSLLASIKAKLNRPQRPIASLLFVGPTGVGKTAMAKAIAQYMYSDPHRMVRFDMSEYNHAAAAERLIGGFTSGEGLLTSRIRETPFTVLLFDEFEKAHPAVFDLLLQVLGEGRLTDGRGRLADFTTAIIIMTSNLGVASFRQSGIGFGESQGDHYREHFIAEIQRHVRPEFFNRIDRVVPFSPLDPDSINTITRRELDLFQKRDGIANRPINFHIDSTVVDHLAAAGFDARYGARPLKRAINRQLAWPLSDRLNRFARDTELNATLRAQDSGLHFDVRSVESESRQNKTAKSTEKIQQRPAATTNVTPRQRQDALSQLSLQRRRAQALSDSPTASRIRNELYRHQQSLQRFLKPIPKHKRDQVRYSTPHIVDLEETMRRLESLTQQMQVLLDEALESERNALARVYAHQPIEVVATINKSLRLKTDIDRMILALFIEDSESARQVSLVLFSRHLKHLRTLADVYQQIAEQNNFKAQFYRFHRPTYSDAEFFSFPLYPSPSEEAPKPPPSTVVSTKSSLDDVFRDPPKPTVGLALSIKGSSAYQRFAGERGIHLFRGSSKENVLVETSGETVTNLHIDPAWVSLASFDQHELRRVYDSDRQLVFDKTLDQNFPVIDEDWRTAMIQAMESGFQKNLESMIDLWS